MGWSEREPCGFGNRTADLRHTLETPHLGLEVGNFSGLFLVLHTLRDSIQKDPRGSDEPVSCPGCREWEA